MTDMEDKPERSGRGVRIALFASLAVNILIVGMIAGALLRGDGRPARQGDLSPAFDAGIGPFGQAMTREERRELAQRIAGHRDAFRQNRARMQTHLVEILAVLRTQPFDGERLRQVVAGAQQALAERQQIGTQALLAQVEAMTDAERAAFADRLERGLRRVGRPR